MEYDIQTLIEQKKISDLLINYAVALDSRNWDLLETCFLSDAVVDYGPTGGQHKGFPEILKTVRYFLDSLTSSQHMTGNYKIEITGEEATCSSYLIAQHYLEHADGQETLMLGGVYFDKIRKTEDGWKFKERKLETWWVQGNDQLFEISREKMK